MTSTAEALYGETIMPPERPERPAVIGDVARLAGVSVPTVSRVLTGAAKVSPEKTKRVLQAIESLGYRPSATARALVHRRSSVIAIFAGNTARYGYAETIRGIEDSARNAGYQVSITVVDSTAPDDIKDTIDLTLQQPIAGVVVLKFDPAGVAVLAALPQYLPTVSLSGEIGGKVPQAVIDEAWASERLTEHLLDLGHSTVHYVRVPPSGKEDGRTTGWRRALTEHGIALPDIFDATWDPSTGREIGHRIAADPHVTAVLCGNDDIAMGVIRGLVDCGLSVPEDVSVVGFDDHPIAALFMPALTTARQDFAAMGRRGFQQLDALMRGNDVKAMSSENPTIVLRESSTTAPTVPRSPATPRQNSRITTT
jgi:DNA-binding LacI/PurR family transcriptional regulator